MLSPKNISILKFLLLHKFLLERKHLQFFAKLFAVLIAAFSSEMSDCLKSVKFYTDRRCSFSTQCAYQNGDSVYFMQK